MKRLEKNMRKQKVKLLIHQNTCCCCFAGLHQVDSVDVAIRKERTTVFYRVYTVCDEFIHVKWFTVRFSNIEQTWVPEILYNTAMTGRAVSHRRHHHQIIIVILHWRTYFSIGYSIPLTCLITCWTQCHRVYAVRCTLSAYAAHK